MVKFIPVPDDLERDVLAALDAVPVLSDQDPLSKLADLVAFQTVVDRIVRRRVAVLRAQGHTWAGIGGALGVTPQGAQKRFGLDRLLRQNASSATEAKRRAAVPGRATGPARSA